MKRIGANGKRINFELNITALITRRNKGQTNDRMEFSSQMKQLKEIILNALIK